MEKSGLGQYCLHASFKKSVVIDFFAAGSVYYLFRLIIFRYKFKEKTSLKSSELRIEIHILSLHWMMKNISYFNVCEAQRASRKH